MLSTAANTHTGANSTTADAANSTQTADRQHQHQTGGPIKRNFTQYATGIVSVRLSSRSLSPLQSGSDSSCCLQHKTTAKRGPVRVASWRALTKTKSQLDVRQEANASALSVLNL